MIKKFWLILLLILSFSNISSQKKHQYSYKLIAYYSNDKVPFNDYDYSRITHLIYSFGHVNEEGIFSVDKPNAEKSLQQLQNLKQKYPHLKTMVALGGWGGCELCSAVFNDSIKTSNFISSVSKFLEENHLDGFDFDWEYPTEGYPDHLYAPTDKDNFTSVIKKLRFTLPPDKIISFAAGGFTEYLDKAVDWKALDPYIDMVNLMSYDLVGGYSQVTGHQTPLYSYTPNSESVDKAIKFFERINFPLNKVIIGATFYTRAWKNVPNINNGLCQSGKFERFIDYKYMEKYFKENPGFHYFWDGKSQAAHWYNAKLGIFVTGDDRKSLKAKSKYVKSKKLGGLMFWELSLDVPNQGLLEAIDINK